MQRSELALVTVRKDRGERAWSHFGAVREPVDNCYLSARSSCRARAFPTHQPDGAPNVDRGALASWASRLDAPPPPMALLRYALCVLASPSYRARFDAALRADYPRIPPPASTAAFHACVEAGEMIEAAFCASADASASAPVIVGHHLVPAERAGALTEAIAASERALAPTLA